MTIYHVNLKTSLLGLTAAVAVTFGSIASVSAVVLPTNCTAGQTIASRLAIAVPGDIIFIGGVCAEDVLITTDNLTLRTNAALAGQIIGTGADHTVRIRANNVVLDGGLSISSPAGSTRIAIVVQRSASATIDGNTIKGDRHGIAVNQNSYARIINNPSISGTTGHGVNINQASGADIHDNMIHDSGNRGINLVRIGAADVTGNTIDNNADNGIGVFRGSHLELDDGFNGGAANIIQNNGDFGIGCGSNSSIGTDEVFQVFAGNVGGPSSIGGSCTVSNNIGDPNL